MTTENETIYTKQIIKNQVLDAISEHFEYFNQHRNLNLNDKLKEDLNMDSLDLVELSYAVERRLGHEFYLDEAVQNKGVETVQNLIDYIDKQMNEQKETPKIVSKKQNFLNRLLERQKDD